MIVSTTNEIAGYRIVQHLGLVRGVTVRSRSVVGNFFGGIQSIFGGRLSVYAHLVEVSRQEAFDHMCQHAAEGGANAILRDALRRNGNLAGSDGGSSLWHGCSGRAVVNKRRDKSDSSRQKREGPLGRLENDLEQLQ